MKSSLLFIFPYLLKEKKLFLFGSISTIIAAFFTWLSPQMIARLIDSGFFKKFVVFFALSEMAKLILSYFNQKIFAVFGQNVIEHIRKSMITHLMKVPVSYFDRSSSGQIMTRFVNDANSLTDFFQSGMISIMGNVFSVIAIFIGMYSLHHQLSLLMLIVFIPFFIACSYFSEKLRLAYEESRNQLSLFNSMLADFLYGMKTIRSLSLSHLKNKLLSNQIQSYSDSQVKMVREFAFFNPVLSLGIGVLFFVLVLKGIPLVDSGDMKTGEWIGILSYIFMLQQPLMEITDRWNFFLAGVTSIQRIKNVFDVKEEKILGNPISDFAHLELQNTTFRYSPNGKTILNSVNLKIKKGDRIGIFGESGSGKTTLLQLLYGFYPPWEGKLLWNGVSYEDISLEELRKQFGVVEQFPFLFSGTIRDNIDLFGKVKIDFSSVMVIFSKYPLITSILNRLNEEVRERGANLSMGEKQMISFLRAYFKSPRIWILDEATAFFDQEAENEFMDILRSLPSDVVIIQIAHRREALKDMSRVIQVEQSCLLE